MLEHSRVIMTLGNNISNIYSEPKNWMVSPLYSGESNVGRPVWDGCVPQVGIICLKHFEFDKNSFHVLSLLCMCIDLQLNFCDYCFHKIDLAWAL